MTVPVPSFEGKTSGNDKLELIVDSRLRGKDRKKREKMNIIKRVKAPTPKFFKVLRNIGLAMAAIGGTILAAPVALPVLVTTVGGYMAVAGGVVSAVSQLTTNPETPEKSGQIPEEGITKQDDQR
jgi:hypothetical protein